MSLASGRPAANESTRRSNILGLRLADATKILGAHEHARREVGADAEYCIICRQFVFGFPAFFSCALVQKLSMARAPRQLLAVFEGHTDEVRSAQFSPEGRWAVSASHDRTLCLWPLP